jgi:two-component system alkaline phosphatase synthesis response regulator PhoP
MESMYSILILGYDSTTRQNLIQTFEQKEFDLNTVESIYDALLLLKQQEFDLMFVDFKASQKENIAMLNILRQMSPEMPVLALIPRNNECSSLEAVRQVSWDYLIKPVDPALMLVRAREILDEREQICREQAILSEVSSLLNELHESYDQADELAGDRQIEAHNRDIGRYFQFGPFILDTHARRLLCDEQAIPMTSSIFEYFLTLARHAPDPVPYESLVKESQNYQLSSGDALNMVRWRIHQLRKLIEQNPQQPRYILTVRGYGYRLSITEA